MRAFTLTLAVVIGVIFPACGSDRTGGPRGSAESVVGKAPQLTFAARRTQVTGASKGVTTEGPLDLQTGRARMVVEGEGRPGPFLTDPVLALDLVAGAVNIRSYGGVQVQKASAFRYEVDIDPAKVLAAAPSDRRARLDAAMPDQLFYADVFVDGAGRVRRVLLPIDLTEPRPMGDSKRIATMLSVDFHDFPEED
jgi:hypothetical protein